MAKGSLKVVAMLRKRADISREDFMRYYEQNHAPLILSLMPGIVEYRRNFTVFDGAYVNGGAAPFDFDVLTEIRFRDRAAYDAAMAIAADPAVAKRIADDEANFLDSTGNRMFVVEESASALDGQIG